MRGKPAKTEHKAIVQRGDEFAAPDDIGSTLARQAGRELIGFPVVILILDASPGLRSGLAAGVTFHFDTGGTAGTFILPVSAVINGTDGTFVFIHLQRVSTRRRRRPRGLHAGLRTAKRLTL